LDNSNLIATERLPWSDLSLPDQVFCRAYLDPTADTHYNATRSYKLAHPAAEWSTCAVNGYRKTITLRKYIGEAIPTKDWIAEQILLIIAKTDDPAIVLTALRDTAKLGGHLVDKFADVTEPADLSPDQLSKALRDRALIS
jgi:hypothetical protein